jgi:hypothetical protein
MIKSRGMTLDAKVRVVVSDLIDFSGSANPKIIHFDPDRAWVVQRVDAVAVEAAADNNKKINLGTVADPDSLFDADESLVSGTAAGAAVNITTTPFTLTANVAYTASHDTTTGAGTGHVILQMIPRDDNPNNRGDHG